MNSLFLLKQEKGSTIIIFLFMMAMLMALAVGALQLTSLNLESAYALKKGKKVFYIAESGLDQAIGTIIKSFENLVPYVPSKNYIALKNYRGHNLKYKITQSQPRYLYQTVSGQDIMNHYAYSYDIAATANSNIDNSSETLLEKIQILETPLVQWFIFYSGGDDPGDADLEISSGSNWTSWGRIHTNGDFYIGSVQGAFHRFQNFDPDGIRTPHAITVAGKIIPGIKDNYPASVDRFAEAKITNTTTVWEDFETIDVTIDKNNKITEEARFNDFLLVNEQVKATPGPVIIQRGGFYESVSLNPKSPGVDGITIIGQGDLKHDGITITVSNSAISTDVTDLIAHGETSPGVLYTGPFPIIQEKLNVFGDCREGRRVDITDIDLSALTLWYREYLADPAGGGGISLGGGGFMIYASRSPGASFTNQSGHMQTIRLRSNMSGSSISQLQANTTFVTDNPLYIQGDFNTINRKGVAIIADAINILSNSWNDTKKCGRYMPDANITTSVNAAFFTGNAVGQLGGEFQGGAINYPRFHERWVSTAFNYRGAFINLWASSQANGDWCLGGDCYTAPIRNWGWDTNFGNPDYWPPYLPSVYSVERLGFLE